MLVVLTLNSTFVAKLYLQVRFKVFHQSGNHDWGNLEEVNRELWKSILNFTEILSCNCLSFLAFVVFLCGETPK